MSLPLLSDYIIGVQNGSIDPYKIIAQCQKKASINELHSWILHTPEYVEGHQTSFINKHLCGAPLGIKDIIMTQGAPTTCGSKMLMGYTPNYSATCFSLLEKAGGLMIGKNSMDEFAMGSSGEHCFQGPTYNPWDHSRVSGGSSSGSAASVANEECLGALGTDTGGSVRLPASFCGIVGFKPTYGHISRYGVQSMSNSLDQVGVFGRSVNDARILYHTIRGYDSMDMTSSPNSLSMVSGSKKASYKCCVFNQFLSDGVDPEIKDITLKTIKILQDNHIQVDMIDFPWIKHLVATYYIICPAEVMTNMARFDGLRYGLQDNTELFTSLKEYSTFIRSQGFGQEVKRRLLIGAHVLSSGFQDQYYHKAMAIVKKSKTLYHTLFDQYDAILSPTTPLWPWKIGGHTHDPLSDYLADMYTIPANLIGSPAISIPMGFGIHDSIKLPTGLHLMGSPHNDELLLHLAEKIENILASYIQ